MSYKLILAIVSACLLATTMHAQQRAIKFDGRNPEGKQYFFVGEIHSIDERWAFYESLVTHLATHNGIRNIVLEAGHSKAWLLNQYVHQGDTTYFHYFPQDTALRHFADQLRTINSNLSTDHKINIRGIDFERMEFAIVSRKILSEHAALTTTALYKYIHSLPDSLLTKVRKTREQTVMRAEVYTRACELFKTEKETLKQQLGSNYPILELMFENPSSEQHFANRDNGMYANIINQHLLDKPFLCIVGQFHTEIQTIDLHPSLLKLLTKHHQDFKQKLALINEVHNGSFTEQRLMLSEGTPQKVSYGKSGPNYFIRHKRPMHKGFTAYLKPNSYTLAYKTQFPGPVKKRLHKIDTWYVFFGEHPQRKKC